MSNKPRSNHQNKRQQKNKPKHPPSGQRQSANKIQPPSEQQQPANEAQHPTADQMQQSSWKATVVLILISTVAISAFALVSLNRFYYLPPIIGNFVDDMQLYAQTLAGIGIFGGFAFLWKKARKWLAMSISIILVSIFVLAYIILPGSVTGSPKPPQEPAWSHHDSWKAAYCDNTNKNTKEWVIGLPGGTGINCSQGRFLMWQEQHGLSKLYYGEVDLAQIKGTTYNQNNFKFTTTITFITPADFDTKAGILVQTPADEAGGFGLLIKSNGQCEGQSYGKSRIPTPFPCKNVELQNNFVVLTIMVLDQRLYGFINGNSVLSIHDTLQDGRVGFIIELDGGQIPSSRIQFSDTHLDTL